MNHGPHLTPTADAARPFDTFDRDATASVLGKVETLLEALAIVHAAFEYEDDAIGYRRIARALEPIITALAAETETLRDELFHGGADRLRAGQAEG